MKPLNEFELLAITGGQMPVASWPAIEIPGPDNSLIEDILGALGVQSIPDHHDWIGFLSIRSEAA